MKKGFTIVEVSILFVIFIIVTFLVAPLSLDDTKQAKNASRWRNVQADFVNIVYSMSSEENSEETNLIERFDSIINNEVKENVKPYKILFMNGTYPSKSYLFKDYKKTYSNAVVAYKFYDEPVNEALGVLMYDVNGTDSPNVWGKDVFGLKIYNDGFEPLGKENSLAEQKQDCSRNGTGLYCSNYYLIGGNFE